MKQSDKQKHVLIFDPISRAGGGLAYLLNAIPEFRNSEKYRFTFYCNRALKPVLEKKFPECDIIYTSEKSSKGGALAFFNRIFFSKRILKSIAPDTIIYMNQIPFKTKVPSILFLRNALYYITKDPDYIGPVNLFFELYCSFFRQVTSLSIKRAQAIMTSSETFSQIVSRFHEDKKYKLVAPFGINDVRSDEPSKRFTKPEIRLMFLQYNIYKGLDIAVEALKILIDKKYTVRLIITDNVNKYNDKIAKKIQNYIKIHSLYRYIDMVGTKSQEDLKQVYQTSDVFLFPSYVESFGQGLLEAMSNGLPCVVSDLPVFKELAETSVCYFETGNPDKLADQIIRLINESDFRNELVKKSIEKSREFSWKKHVHIIEEYLHRIG
jgi:glycosyltransferase involved in cell wall biosynthesis